MPNQKKIQAFDDLISEKDLKAKIGCSSKTLQRLRTKGVITGRTITGRNYMYSKTELATILNLQTN